MKELLLDGCGFTEEGCAALAHALTQHPKKEHHHHKHPPSHPVSRTPISENRPPSCSADSASPAQPGAADPLRHSKKSSMTDRVSVSHLSSSTAALWATGAAAVVSGRTGGGLVKIDLSRNNIGQQGLLSLSNSVPSISTLQELVLRDCQVSAADELLCTC